MDRSNFRSIAINDLKSRFDADENVQVIYMYFDYKSQQSQSVVDVAMGLLKQLLASQQVDVPSELESLYSTSTKPNLATCKRLLAECAKRSGTIYAVFDAIDECGEISQQDILDLFGHLQQTGPYRMLISSRPHLLQNLRDQLKDTRTLEIYANKSDLKNYITKRLHEKGVKDANLKNRCLELANSAQGM